MVDLVNNNLNKFYFRTILKAAYEDIRNGNTPNKNYQEIGYLFNTDTDNEPIAAPRMQICYIQLDKYNNLIDGILFTYSPHDEQYRRFELVKK